jgi:hypothetical protein
MMTVWQLVQEQAKSDPDAPSARRAEGTGPKVLWARGRPRYQRSEWMPGWSGRSRSVSDLLPLEALEDGRVNALEGLVDRLGVVQLPDLQEYREARNGRQTRREVATKGTARFGGG